MDIIQNARARMLIKHVFFATIMVASPFIKSSPAEGVKTAATDMKSIYYNPDFLGKLSLDEIIFVLCHEVMHIILKHGLRRQNRDPELWNYACDYAINLILKEAGMTMPNLGLLDVAYKGMSEEQIYQVLKDKPKNKGGGGGGRGLPQNPMDGDVMDAPSNGPTETAELDRSINQRLAQASAMAKLAGKLPAGLERLINEVLNPKVPWTVLFRDFMNRIVLDHESWNKRNRRFKHTFLPARHNMKMPEVIVIGDTSGSIGGEELKQYAGEMQSIIEDTNPERVRVIWADATVAGEQVLEPGEPIVFKPKGGGGTDMRVPLKHIEQYEPTVAVLLTDGYTPWPTEEPPYPLIVVCTTEVACPIGSVVRI